ncbi:MAG: phosphoenolpyruvate carboxykinase (ATP) [Candidatus Fermentibacteraceae bacterium]|nr:phosphoenolpyruvate carboxykinase (ATP) [Candidatus Fermentibacteraceae bacterium]MBN2608463.1 phosphoenolpyruvate carboxykinase (ATP) [Candidatus Fermentibacteraceae bacterium]
MSLQKRISDALDARGSVYRNIPRSEMIRKSVERGEAVVSDCGALSTWTPTESTGRSPKDTVVVRRDSSSDTIDWTSPNNIPIDEETFDMVFEDALRELKGVPEVFVTDRLVGADPAYALPVHTISDMALPALFTDNMFRPWDGDIARGSCFAQSHFTLLVLPYHKLDPDRYEGRIRVDPRLGHTSTMIVAMDMDRSMGIVYGSAYGGSVKKLIFTVMNYILPAQDILPLHCSANEGEDGRSALLLGLSGTGKTTLSADPSRALLGDDEHGWGDEGIANFENGCYAKLINLSSEKEPEIYNACFHRDDWLSHGAIIENTMMYPDGRFDLFDERLTPNSRGSYPLRYLTNTKESSRAGHPSTILFLTADANGVIPPVSRLNRGQAMFWFLMGYTSKLAGTETGVTEPVSTFSRFFGAPFMPRNPDVYASMLGERMERYGTEVYLVNTGWSGGPYGVGSRIDLPLTRMMVDAVLTGRLSEVGYHQDPVFRVMVPDSCPGLPDQTILDPVNTWDDGKAYLARANRLAAEFRTHFDRAYGDKGISPEIAMECPRVVD